MQKFILKQLYYIFIFLTGGAVYNILELLWRGYTHISMSILGGICFLIIYLTQKHMHAPTFFKALFCAVVITFSELITGFIVNIAFKLNVWDYSKIPFNIHGQICFIYSLLWYVLSFPALSFAKKIAAFFESDLNV